MARPFLLLTILNDAGSLHAIPPGADAEISGHAPLVAELVGHANQTTTNDMADGACSRRRVPEGFFPSAAVTRVPSCRIVGQRFCQKSCRAMPPVVANADRSPVRTSAPLRLSREGP